jgi:DNA-binding IscR family transcriptional regulator
MVYITARLIAEEEDISREYLKRIMEPLEKAGLDKGHNGYY